MILLKYILKEFKSKKLRTFILVLSICLASAMLFASLTLSKTLVELQRDSYKASVGTADIVVLSKEKQFFELTDLNCNEVATDRVIPKLNVTGLFDKRTQSGSLFFQINGFDYDDIQNFNPIEFDKVDNKSFEGKEVIIGSYTAEKLGLDIGSEFEISINDVKYNFNVYGIAKKTGLFAFDGQRYSAIIPITTLREMLKLPQESVSELYVVLKTDVDKENALQKLSDENPELKVDYSYSEEEIEEESKNLIVQMYVLLIIISIMSFYIIYSSFKVLILERMPVIGTFRSIGANKRQTSLMLIFESSVYGVLGGILGCFTGLLILYIVVRMSMTGNLENVNIELTFSVIDIIIAFLWAVVLAIVSAILPVLSANKKSIKTIVLNQPEIKQVKKSSFVGFMISLIIICAAIGLLYVPFKKGAIVFDSISLVLLIIGAFRITSYIIHFIASKFEKLYSLFFGNAGLIALKNIKNSSESINNVLLLTLAVATAISVFTVTGSIVFEINNVVSSSYHFDYIIKSQSMNDEFRDKLVNIEEIQDSYGLFSQRNVSINDSEKTINVVEGIDTHNYLDFRSFDFEGTEAEKKECIEKLDSGKNIIMTYMLMDKYDLKENDIVSLETNDGKVDYTVVGSFYSMLESGGNYALISEENLKEDFNIVNYSQFYIKSEDPAIETKLFLEFPNDNISITSIDELIEVSKKSSEQKTNIFNGLSCVVIIICFFGLLNNLIMNYLERRKTKAIMRSIGMTKSKGILIVLVEALTCGIFGGLIGVAEGLGIIHISKFVMKAINKPYAIKINPSVFVMFFTIALVSSVLSFVFLEMKTRKMSISEEIKGR